VTEHHDVASANKTPSNYWQDILQILSSAVPIPRGSLQIWLDKQLVTERHLQVNSFNRCLWRLLTAKLKLSLYVTWGVLKGSQYSATHSEPKFKMISFTSRPLYPQQKGTWYQLCSEIGWPLRRSRVFGEQTNFLLTSEEIWNHIFIAWDSF
jgi:hypothetical protein